VFAVAAGSWRIPSPSATASGAPDRLLCPDSVRYMSVIMGSVEHVTAYCGGLRRWPERAADTGPVAYSRRSARYKRTQQRPVGKARMAGENPARAPCPASSGGFADRLLRLAVPAETSFRITALTC